jgi:hypothetical protein
MLLFPVPVVVSLYAKRPDQGPSHHGNPAAARLLSRAMTDTHDFTALLAAWHNGELTGA